MKQKGAMIQQMSVDDLDEKISVVYFETTRNSKGDIVKSEEVLRCNVWAKILPLTGKIQDSTPARENTLTYRITIRHRADIKPDDIIVWRGRRLKITTPPLDIELKHMWTLFNCEEVITDGAT